MAVAMPKKATSKKPKPTGLPTKPPVAPSQMSAKAAAEAAVKEYEAQRKVLDTMRSDWEENHPEAFQERQDVLHQEDVVTETIKTAKPLVSAAAVTVGGFKCVTKNSTAAYNNETVSRLLAGQDNCGELFEYLLKNGVLESVVIDKKVAPAWMARNPEYSELFETAWEKSKPLGSAVTVPKL